MDKRKNVMKHNFSFLKKDLDKIFIYILLIVYLIFSGALICHFVLPDDSWSNSVVPLVSLFCAFSVVICVKKVFSYKVRLSLVVLFCFIQLFYYGLHESAFRDDFHMVLGMFLFMLLFTDEFIFTVIGVFLYFVLLAIHTYQSRSFEYLEYFFTPIFLFPLFFVLSFFIIKMRKNASLKYAYELESYKRKCIESEEYLHRISHILRRRLNSISCIAGSQVEKNPSLENDENWILVKNDILRLSNHIDVMRGQVLLHNRKRMRCLAV